MKSNSHGKLGEFLRKRKLIPKSKAVPGEHEYLSSHPKFSRITRESRRKSSRLLSANKIGVLNTRRQPSGSNAYFNILKQKYETQPSIRNSQEFRKSLQRKTSVGLECSNCTCAHSCSCGRKFLIHRHNEGKVLADFFDCIDWMKSSQNEIKHRCTGELKLIRKSIKNLRRRYSNSLFKLQQ